MAIAHDAKSRWPAAGLNTATGDQSFAHTGTNPKGAVIVIGHDADTTVVTGVLYAGVAMTLVGFASDTSEAGRITIYALTSGVATGLQSITLQGTAAGNKYAVMSTVTAATSTTSIVGSAFLNTTTGANPTVNITTTATAWLYGGLHGGEAAPGSYGVGASYSRMDEADYGQRSSVISRSTAAQAAGTFAFNFTDATSEDYCIGVAAIAETVVAARVPRGSATNFQDPGVMMERLGARWKRRWGSGLLVPEFA